MTFLIDNSGLIIVAFVICATVAAGTAILEAYIDTRKRPREAMLWCNKHGFYRKEHALPLFPHMPNETLVCPQCYKQAVYDDVQVKG